MGQNIRNFLSAFTGIREIPTRKDLVNPFRIAVPFWGQITAVLKWLRRVLSKWVGIRESEYLVISKDEPREANEHSDGQANAPQR